MSVLAALFIYASTCTLSNPDLLKPKNLPAASTYGRATPTLIYS
jgi:hypothetical protein